MYNAVYIALKDLKKVVAKNVDEIRRQSIVVLSDGEDTSSLVSFDEVLDPREAVRDGHLHDRSALERDARHREAAGFKEAEFVLRQFRPRKRAGRSFFPKPV